MHALIFIRLVFLTTAFLFVAIVRDSILCDLQSLSATTGSTKISISDDQTRSVDIGEERDYDLNDIGSQNDCVDSDELKICLRNCENTAGNRDCRKEEHEMQCYGICAAGCRYIEDDLSHKCVLHLLSHVKRYRDGLPTYN